MKRYLSGLGILIFAPTVFASNFGNFPATVNIWIVGSLFAVIIAMLMTGNKKLEFEKQLFRFIKYFLMIELAVFVFGILAFFS